jgi:hypothetical protein
MRVKPGMYWGICEGSCKAGIGRSRVCSLAVVRRPHGKAGGGPEASKEDRR